MYGAQLSSGDGAYGRALENPRIRDATRVNACWAQLDRALAPQADVILMSRDTHGTGSHSGGDWGWRWVPRERRERGREFECNTNNFTDKFMKFGKSIVVSSMKYEV